MLLRDQAGAHSLRDAFEVTVEFFVAVVVGDITLCSDPCLYQGLGRPPPTWSLGVWEERIITLRVHSLITFSRGEQQTKCVCVCAHIRNLIP